MLVELESLDFQLGVAEEVDAIFKVLDPKQDIALDVLFPAENVAGKVLFFRISEYFCHHVLIKFFLNWLKSALNSSYTLHRPITFSRGA